MPVQFRDILGSLTTLFRGGKVVMHADNCCGDCNQADSVLACCCNYGWPATINLTAVIAGGCLDENGDNCDGNYGPVAMTLTGTTDVPNCGCRQSIVRTYSLIQALGNPIFCQTRGVTFICRCPNNGIEGQRTEVGLLDVSEPTISNAVWYPATLLSCDPVNWVATIPGPYGCTIDLEGLEA